MGGSAGRERPTPKVAQWIVEALPEPASPVGAWGPARMLALFLRGLRCFCERTVVLQGSQQPVPAVHDVHVMAAGSSGVCR